MNEKKMKVNIWMIVIVIIIIVIILAIVLGPKTKRYDMAEWRSVVYEWEVLERYSLNEESDFPGLDIGDKVKITGIVTNVTYNSLNDESVLCLDDIEFYWSFEGNLSKKLVIGDEITITLSIEYNDSYCAPSEYIAEINSENQILASTITINT